MKANDLHKICTSLDFAIGTLKRLDYQIQRFEEKNEFEQCPNKERWTTYEVLEILISIKKVPVDTDTHGI